MQQVKIHTERKYFFQCPNCDSAEKHYIGHLMEEVEPDKPKKFGPWTCRVCHHILECRLTAEGNDILLEVEAKPSASPDRSQTGLVLLRSDTQGGDPIFLVVKNRHITGDKDKAAEHAAFYYDSHTCPTNWTRDIVKVINRLDTDPHGVFEYVTHVLIADLDPTFREDRDFYRLGELDFMSEQEHEEAKLRTIFPQAFEAQYAKPQSSPTLG